MKKGSKTNPKREAKRKIERKNMKMFGADSINYLTRKWAIREKIFKHIEKMKWLSKLKKESKKS